MEMGLFELDGELGLSKGGCGELLCAWLLCLRG